MGAANKRGAEPVVPHPAIPFSDRSRDMGLLGWHSSGHGHPLAQTLLHCFPAHNRLLCSEVQPPHRTLPLNSAPPCCMAFPHTIVCSAARFSLPAVHCHYIQHRPAAWHSRTQSSALQRGSASLPTVAMNFSTALHCPVVHAGFTTLHSRAQRLHCSCPFSSPGP